MKFLRPLQRAEIYLRGLSSERKGNEREDGAGVPDVITFRTLNIGITLYTRTACTHGQTLNRSQPLRLGRRPGPYSEPPSSYRVEWRPFQAMPLCSRRSYWAARCWSGSFVVRAQCCRQQPGARQPFPLELRRMRPCSSLPLHRQPPSPFCSPTACWAACWAASCAQVGLCGSMTGVRERLGAREHAGCIRMLVLPTN